jgi:hypothetical protein
MHYVRASTQQHINICFSSSYWNACSFLVPYIHLLLLGVRGKPRMYCSLLAYCTARFGRSNFSILDAPAPTDAFSTLAAEVGTTSGNRPVNFAEMPTSTVHLGIFYMPQIRDMGPTALLPFRRKAWLRIFPLLKIRRLRPGLNPRTWVPEASTLTPRPPKPLTYTCTKHVIAFHQ